jgi:uncharacterized protein
MELITLQTLDDEAAALRAALADVERQLRGDDELATARRELMTASQAREESQRNQRRVEMEIATLTAKIVPEEKRLYDGSVRNPKELGAIQHELELLKPARAKYEDELLETMTRGEVEDRERTRAQRAVEQLEARWLKRQQELKHEVNRLTDGIARADVKRDAQKAKVPPRSIVVYEDVRRRKGGMAVARVIGGTCQGCRVTVPEAIRKRAFGSEILAQCPNCDRILSLG